jgi:hypothetical protein
VPEEIRFFGRSALFGLAIGVAYWFLTYETAGTVLLLAFGSGSLLAALAFRLGLGRRPPAEARPGIARRALAWLRLAPEGLQGPFLRDPTRLPGSSLAPIVTGVGIALAALGLIYGLWLVAVGAAVMLIGGAAWLREAAAEAAASEAAGERAAQPPVCRSRTRSASSTSEPTTSQPARRRGSPARPR